MVYKQTYLHKHVYMHTERKLCGKATCAPPTCKPLRVRARASACVYTFTYLYITNACKHIQTHANTCTLAYTIAY